MQTKFKNSKKMLMNCLLSIKNAMINYNAAQTIDSHRYIFIVEKYNILQYFVPIQHWLFTFRLYNEIIIYLIIFIN